MRPDEDDFTTRPFTRCKVFSCTMQKERDKLGERIAQWLAAHPGVCVVDTVVVQSSDQSFHCISIVLFYDDGPA